MRTFAVSVVAALLLPIAAAVGYVGARATEPGLPALMEAELEEVARSEGVSFVPTAGPFKGMPAPAEDVLDLEPYELRALGVNLKKGRFVHQVCTYYTPDGTPDVNSPANTEAASYCEQRHLTLAEARAWNRRQPHTPSLGRRAPAA